MTIQFEKTHLNPVDGCKTLFINIEIGDTFRYPVEPPEEYKGTKQTKFIKPKDKKVYIKIKDIVDVSNIIHNYYNAIDFNGCRILIDDKEWVQPIEITANWKFSLG